MMEQSLRIYVVKKNGRRNLYLRFEPEDGIPKEKSAGTHIKREAERAAARWEKELLAGEQKPKANYSWDEFRRKFTELHLSSKRPKTVERYDTVLNSIEDILKPKHVRTVTAQKVLEWQNKLRELGHPESTVSTHSGHLKATLRWAAKFGYLSFAPSVDMPSVDNSMLMRGRPISVSEFGVLMRSVKLVAKERDTARAIRMLMRGLFWGGLRLSEALKLHWTTGGFVVDMSGRNPMFRIKSGSEKGKKNRLLPIAPEFADLLLAMKDRTGPVFEMITIKRQIPCTSNISKILSDIGRASGIQTQDDPIRFVTAHDLRRSFGTRWASLVRPLTLMQMMRHSNISTTQKYYVAIDAEETADMLREAIEKRKTAGSTLFSTPAVFDSENPAI